MTEALDEAVDILKEDEGCELRAYPDPASPLSIALVKRKLLSRYKRGEVEIPTDLRHLSGAPWTIGYGETLHVREGMIWTQEQAIERLGRRTGYFMLGVLKRCPALHLEPRGRLVACTTFAYNVGLGAFGVSSVCRHTMRREYQQAGDAFLLWNKAQGRIMPGLTRRRQADRKRYLEASWQQ